MKDLRDEEEYERLPIKTRKNTVGWEIVCSGACVSNPFITPPVTFNTPLKSTMWFYHKQLSCAHPARDT